MKYDLNKKTNRFAERTLAAFSESLMQLLETKALESITVNELCETCNYPRATFYNYFDDIYDLLNYVWYCMEKDIDISDYPEIRQEERIYEIFSRVYDYFVTWHERLDKVMKHNPVGGAFVLSCGRYVRSRTTEILKATGCDTTHEIPSEMVAEHYGNTIQLVLEWSFLRGASMSKDDALKCLRTLLSEL